MGYSLGQEGQPALGDLEGLGLQGYRELHAHPWGHRDPVGDADSIRTLKPQEKVKPYLRVRIRSQRIQKIPALTSLPGAPESPFSP